MVIVYGYEVNGKRESSRHLYVVKYRHGKNILRKPLMPDTGGVFPSEYLHLDSIPQRSSLQIGHLHDA